MPGIFFLLGAGHSDLPLFNFHGRKPWPNDDLMYSAGMFETHTMSPVGVEQHVEDWCDIDDGEPLPKTFGDGSLRSLSFFSDGGDSSTGGLI